MQRIATPHPIGPVEGIYGGKGVRPAPGQYHGDVIVGYDGGSRETEWGEMLPAPTEPYRVVQEHTHPGPANWGVRSAEGNLAEVVMNGADRCLGTREQAEAWAKKINARWGLSE